MEKGSSPNGSRLSYVSRHTEVQGFSSESEKGIGNTFASQTISRTTWEKYGIENRTDLHLVEFLPNDPENPRNWSDLKKILVSFQLCLLVVAVYAGASIYTVGTQGVQVRFGVSDTVALLGLTVFVLGYGLGLMIWSPLSEVPQIGRNTIFIPALVIFILAQVPTALATSIGMLLIFRFIAGFFGSPILGAGDGILTDMYESRKHMYAMVGFALVGICGPTLGKSKLHFRPIIGGFAVQAKGWQWTMWIVCWASTLVLVVLVLFLPETSAENILYRRTMRLRRVTGDLGFVCEAQLKADNTRGVELLKAHLIRPFTLVLTDPAVFFLNLHSSFTYGFMYIWFESLPLAYKEVYHFDIGTATLALLGLIVGVLVVIPPFFLYYRLRIEPKYARNGKVKPEKHLHPAMLGSLLLPGSLVWFGWTARPSIHWAVPIAGSSLFTAGALLLYISILNYLAESYPKHIASVLAGNELFASMCGATFPLLIPSMFHKFGVLGSSMILAIVAMAFVPIPYVIAMRGPKLRKRSTYAAKG
ncbi:major facilitator superfamily transporter [Colletotrichum graminicola M1.001]|uniref:Major facilitator superfamily transporter n=1 Tax=Colletotrichum graminicola (strain M1.001 / M2 / FGSC 10212) TaxID=645133 RepID=E3QGD1_COLGM|nr:major facilitator superfamily transporter [Colletotrichum graminicola M1.001]EFQ29919.1 major facilitator superfamily transporter [Colletotrichum graminicola M1.001]